MIVDGRWDRPRGSHDGSGSESNQLYMRRYRMRYSVNIKKTEEGYAVWVPGLPGCWSQGATEDEALENIKEAIQDYLHTVNLLTVENEIRYVDVAHA